MTNLFHSESAPSFEDVKTAKERTLERARSQGITDTAAVSKLAAEFNRSADRGAARFPEFIAAFNALYAAPLPEGLARKPDRLTLALAMAARGFRVFPCKADTCPGREAKEPSCQWQQDATTDPAIIRDWFIERPDINYGVAMPAGRFVLDLDCKGDANGRDVLGGLEIDYDPLPATLTVRTPSGGEHVYLAGSAPNSVRKKELGRTIDVRGDGGYVVGPGSIVDGKIYEIIDDCDLAAAPDWLLKLAAKATVEPAKRDPNVTLGAPAEIGRMQTYLTNLVEQGDVAIEHCGGNNRTYELFCKVLDRLPEDAAYELVAKIWNPVCVPPWSNDELHTICASAVAYRQNEIGARAAPAVAETFAPAVANLPGDEQARSHLTCDQPDDEGTRHFNGLAYRRVSDIKSEKIEWLWLHRIASGALNMIAGLPAEGKSTIALDLAARITRGGELPCGGGAVERAAILIMSAEDHEKQTIKPRLVAAGADVSQCFIVDAMVNEKDHLDKRLLSLASDLERICSLIEKLKREGIIVKLIIIDPISAYVGEGDGHKNTQMRALLTPLSKSAEKHKFGVILISHYKKNAEGTNALYRVTDSLAFVASCRGVLLTEKERDDDGKETGRKLLLNGKPSLIPEGTPGLAYKTESTAVALDDGSTQNLPRIKWDGFVTVTPDEAMANKPGGGGTEKLDRAVDFLEVLLFGSPKPESEVRRRAFGQRITAATLRRAKKKLGIISTRDGALAAGGTWWWALPEGQRPEQAPTAPEPAPTDDDDLPADNFGTMTDALPPARQTTANVVAHSVR